MLKYERAKGDDSFVSDLSIFHDEAGVDSVHYDGVDQRSQQRLERGRYDLPIGDYNINANARPLNRVYRNRDDEFKHNRDTNGVTIGDIHEALMSLPQLMSAVAD